MQDQAMGSSSKPRVADVPRARARFIAQSIQLEEHDVPGVVRGGIVATVLLVVCAFVWAAVTPVNEVAITIGEVVPDGNLHRVQHLEGGILSELLVRNGQEVEEGDVLLEIAPTTSESELKQFNSRRAGLQLQMTRLQAVLDGKAPDFGVNGGRYPELAKAELEIYNAQISSLSSQQQVLSSRLAQRQQEQEREQLRSKNLGRELEVMRQQLEMRERLTEDGAVSRSEYLAFKQRVTETETEFDQAVANVKVAKRAIAEANTALLELDDKQESTLRQEVGKVAAQLAELDESIVRLEDRVRRLHVRAPVAGIITNLSVNSVDSVVEPGATLMEIVPRDRPLLVESRVSTADVGHVREGQMVDVTITTFDPQKFGQIDGQVQHISAYTYLDAEKNPYYKAEITLASQYMGHDASRYQLIPGMTVQANILTGEKTVMDYLLKPVYRGFQNAFTER